MARTWDANLDPKVAELVNAAFDKSWQFVKIPSSRTQIRRRCALG